MLYISGKASSTTIKNKTLARVKTMENTYDTEREEIRIKKKTTTPNVLNDSSFIN